jgi:hypothetical protein
MAAAASSATVTKYYKSLKTVDDVAGMSIEAFIAPVRCFTDETYSTDLLAIVSVENARPSEVNKEVVTGDSIAIVKILTSEEKDAVCTGMYLIEENRWIEDTTPYRNNVYQYQEWYSKGKPHRGGDRAAFISKERYVWYTNGVPDRGNDRPAIVETDGNVFWYTNGKLNRVDGKPAQIFNDGTMKYFVDGVEVSSTAETD